VARAVYVEDRVSPVKELYTFRRFYRCFLDFSGRTAWAKFGSDLPHWPHGCCPSCDYNLTHKCRIGTFEEIHLPYSPDPYVM
jgi:hypothetical protein